MTRRWARAWRRATGTRENRIEIEIQAVSEKTDRTSWAACPPVKTPKNCDTRTGGHAASGVYNGEQNAYSGRVYYDDGLNMLPYEPQG